MSQENVDAILRAYDAFNRGAPEESGLNLSPEFEFVPPAVVPESDVVKGPDALADFFRMWIDTFDDFRFEIEEIVDAGDHVLVMAAVRGTGKDSGIDVSSPSFANVWTIRGDEIVRMEAMPNRAAGMEALGLSE
jgi:ketosteroid isomerase-like protein